MVVSCRTNRFPILFDTQKDLSQKIIDTAYGFSFSTYLNSQVFKNPSKRLLLKSNVPAKYIKDKDIKYLITNDVNVAVCFEVLESKKVTYDSTKFVTEEGVEFFSTMIFQGDKQYKVIVHYHNLNSREILKISFITFRRNNLDLYLYLEGYAVPIVKSIISDNMNKEFHKIERNIFGYMFDSYASNGHYYQAMFYINRLPDSIKIKLNEPISSYETFVGVYPKIKSNKLPKHKKDSITFIPAKEHITKIAPDFDYLLFNEDHADPYCRYVLKTLLPDLVKLGYTNFGVETLADIDHNINEYGFPIHGSGFYSDEPNMANLLREAVKLGMHVFPFEEYSSNCDLCCTRLEKRNFREKGQAKNIIAHSKSHKGKTIILSGHSHIYKHSDNKDLKFMAEYLNELTNDKILSVNQTHQEEYPSYKGMDVIPMTREGEYYIIDTLYKKIDVQILHNTVLKKQNYQLKIGKDCEMEVKIKGKEQGYLAIYEKRENELFPLKAIPLAVVPFNRKSNALTIYLNNGNYECLEFDYAGFPVNITKIECQ